MWPIKAILPLSLARFALAKTFFPSLKSPLPWIEDAACIFEFAFYLHYRVKKHMLITNPPKSSTYVYPEIDKQPHLPPLETLVRQLAQFEAALPEGNAAERSIMKQKVRAEGGEATATH